jgi:lysophospholipase L1-like esterase
LHYRIPQKALKGITNIENIAYPIYEKEYDIRNYTFTYDRINIVMLGDSITAMAEWNKLLGRSDIANRGVGGDRTDGFIKRLDDVYALKPELCFIMGGTNDIGQGVPVEKILENMETIVMRLRERKIDVILQSTLYVSEGYNGWQERNKKIEELNSGLMGLAEKNKVIYLDINKRLTPEGVLEKKYTLEGLHLIKNGYNEWKDIIIPIIKENM